MNDQFATRLRSDVPRSRQSSPPPPDEAQIDWLALTGLIRRRIFLIAVLTVAMTAASLPFILIMPVDYVARTRMILSQPLYAMPDANPDAPFDVNTELERITAPGNIQAVIGGLHLARTPELNPATPTGIARLAADVRSWLGSPTIAPPSVTDAEQRVLDAFYGRLTVRRDGTSGIVQLSFRAADPQRAAQVANKVVTSYVAQRNAQRHDQLMAASDLLTPRIARQRTIHQAELARARGFQEANQLTATPVVSASSQAVAALSQRSDRLEQERASLTATLAMIPQTADKPLTVLANEPASLTALRGELQARQQEIDDRKAQFGADYGGAALAQERIARTRDQIVSGAQAFSASVQAALRTNDTDMQAIRTQLDQAQSGLSRQNVAELQLTDMLRAADTEAQALTALLRQQRAFQTDADIPAVAVEILSPATPPLSPEGRGRKMYLMMVLVVAGLVAILIAGLAELLDRSVRSTEQLRITPDTLPVGMLPRLKRRDHPTLPRMIGRAPQNPYVNALQSMIVMIEASSGGIMPASLLVCPAGGNQSATTTASALAFGLAAQGRRALIVDCHPPDTTRPMRPGRPETALMPDDGDLLRQIPLSGDDGPASGPLSDRIRAILDHAAMTGSVVIFDAPSALTSAKTLQLAVMTTRILLVCRWGATPRRLAQLSAERLVLACDARILMAMDGVDLRRHARSGFRDAPVAAQLAQTRAPRTVPYPFG